MLHPRTPWTRLTRHDGEPDTGGTDTGTAGTDTAAGDTGGAGADQKVELTQAQLDAVIADRLKRQKAQFADYDDLKSQATEWQKLQDAQKTELERERDARTRAEQTAQEALERANRTAVRAAVVAEAAKAGAVDADAVLALLPPDAVTLDDAGAVTGAAEAVTALLEAKPYLKAASNGGRPAGDIDQGARSDAPTDFRKADRAAVDAELARLGISPRR